MDPEFPDHILTLFWDVAPQRLSLTRDQEFVLGRVLSAGGYRSLQWIRERIGDVAIRSYLERTRGRLLSVRQLRFWEVILDFPHAMVEEWVRDDARRIWERRAG